jgi:hypothetical protein
MHLNSQAAPSKPCKSTLHTPQATMLQSEVRACDYVQLLCLTGMHMAHKQHSVHQQQCLHAFLQTKLKHGTLQDVNNVVLCLKPGNADIWSNTSRPHVLPAQC